MVSCLHLCRSSVATVVTSGSLARSSPGHARGVSGTSNTRHEPLAVGPRIPLSTLDADSLTRFTFKAGARSRELMLSTQPSE